jgi:hypothetical protein
MNLLINNKYNNQNRWIRNYIMRNKKKSKLNLVENLYAHAEKKRNNILFHWIPITK